MEYLHWNTVKTELYKLPEEYKYSSALLNETRIDNWASDTYKD